MIMNTNSAIKESMTVTRTSAELWRTQLALECKAFDDAGRLVSTPGTNPDPLHACYAVRHADGATELAFAASAPPWLVDQVEPSPVEDLINRPDAAVARLRTERFEVIIDRFHTYCFEGRTSASHDQWVVRDSAESYSIMVDGRRAAAAASVRSNDTAAELWIETDPGQRRKGFGARVARAWAADVGRAGKIAFYSHLHDNAASAALANRLGVRPLFEIVALNLEPNRAGLEH